MNRAWEDNCGHAAYWYWCSSWRWSSEDSGGSRGLCWCCLCGHQDSQSACEALCIPHVNTDTMLKRSLMQDLTAGIEE